MIMIEKNTKYTIFNSNKSWILTTEKIASSWLKGQFGFQYSTVYMDSFSFEVIKTEEQVNPQHTTEEIFLGLQNKFIHDWNEFKNGSSEYTFIFLIKNPVNKFVSGWIQDFIIRKLNKGFMEYERARLVNHFYHKDVDKFFQYAINEREQINDRFPEVDSIPVEFKYIFEEFCFPARHHENFFYTTASELIQHMMSGHLPQNLYILWKLIFKKPFNFDSTKLHIIDIDLEKDLKNKLENTFAIPVGKEVDKYFRHPYLRYRTYSYLSKDYITINALLQTEIFFWVEIISEIYPKNIYDTPNADNSTSTIAKYKKKYLIPDEYEFYSLETHMNWWQYEVPEMWLTYIDTTNDNERK